MYKRQVFGNPADIEGEVAHMLSEVIPSAEKVRFLKTGGEAVAACIRMARAYTGKNHIIQIGYNGWLNSLSPDGPVLPRMQNTSTRNGVPYPLAALHHSCGFNNLSRIKEIVDETNNEVAAVVVAADSVSYTHLDVYKRQDTGRARQTAKTAAHNFFIFIHFLHIPSLTLFCLLYTSRCV